jgi:hypothetical protein
MTMVRKTCLLATAVILLQSAGGAQDVVRGPASGSVGVTRAAAGTWVQPRTPWGDPDLQGDYTNKYEQGTPFERPAEFDGRRIDDIKGEELADLIKERGVQVILNAPFSGDPLGGNFGGAPAFYDQYEAHKGSRPWFVIDPPDGRIPPVTAKGRERQALRAKARAEARRGRGPSDSYTDHSLYDRCITRGMPGSMMPTNYGNSYTIVQAPGVVAISYEMIHETRIIPLDPASRTGSAPVLEGPRVGSAINSYIGYARGRWDGDTLVVETTNFRPENVYRDANPATFRLIERFRRTAADKVEWSVTIDDPETWTRPWTYSMPLTMNPAERVMEYACHEGNRALENMLSAARAEEREARGGRSPSSR